MRATSPRALPPQSRNLDRFPNRGRIPDSPPYDRPNDPDSMSARTNDRGSTLLILLLLPPSGASPRGQTRDHRVPPGRAPTSKSETNRADGGTLTSSGLYEGTSLPPPPPPRPSNLSIPRALDVFITERDPPSHTHVGGTSSACSARVFAERARLFSPFSLSFFSSGMSPLRSRSRPRRVGRGERERFPQVPLV